MKEYRYSADDEVYIGIKNKPTTWVKTTIESISDGNIIVLDNEGFSFDFRWKPEVLEYISESTFNRGYVIVGKTSDTITDIIKPDPEHITLPISTLIGVVSSMSKETLNQLSKQQLIELVELCQRLI